MARKDTYCLQLYIPKEQEEPLKDLAWRRHQSLTELLRDLINLALESPGSELPGKKIAEDVYQPTREDFYKEIERDVALLRQLDLFDLQRGGCS